MMSSKSIFANTGLCLDLRGRFAAVRRGVLLCKVFSAVVIGAALSTSPQVAQAQDETNETVNVWNDSLGGSPGIVGTNIHWGVFVRNNSDILPEGDPWDENITHCRLFDLYSDSPPTMGTLPAFWSGSVATTNEGATYNVNFSAAAAFFYINPGEKKIWG